MIEAIFFCPECREECKPVRESFGYAGTHCTFGKSGTHYTGAIVSDCCGAEVVTADEIELEDDDEQE